jgi:hypothetical protein
MLTEEESISEASSRNAAEQAMAKLTEDYEKNAGADIDETDEETPPTKEAEDAQGADQKDETEEAAPGAEKATGDDPGAAKDETDKEEEAAPESEAKKEPEEAAPAETAAADDFEKKIEGVQLRKTAHPKTQKALKVVKEAAKEEHKARIAAEKIAKEKDAEIERLKTLKLLDEATEKELQENRTFRRTFDIENDADFNRKYVQGQADLEKQAITVLTGPDVPATSRLPDTTAKFIESAGGILKFSVSQQKMPRNLKDASGNEIAMHDDGTPYTHEEFFNAYIIPAMNNRQKNALNAIVNKSEMLNLDRKSEIDGAKQNADKFFKDRQDQIEKSRTQWTEDFQKEMTKVIDSMGDVAKAKEVPVNATAAEKAAIDAHNARIERARGMGERYAKEWTPKTVSHLIGTTTLYETVIKDQMIEKDNRITALEAELKKKDEWIDRAKNAGKTANRGVQPTGGPVKSEKPKIAEDPETLMQRQMEEYQRQQQGVAA